MATTSKAPSAKKVTATASVKKAAPANTAAPAKKAIAAKNGAVKAKAKVSMFDLPKVSNSSLK